MEQESELNLNHLFTPLTTKKAILWIIAIGFIVYFNGLFNGFVGDDEPQLASNPFVQTIQNALSFFFGGMYYNGGPYVSLYYKPLMMLFFSLSYTLFGANAFPLHLFQLLIHISNTIILFYVFNHFFNKRIGFFLSLTFLAHPINSESVFYISALQETLFFFFGIWALWLSMNYKLKSHRIMIALLLLFSLFSKESGILFIVIIFLFLLIFERKRVFEMIPIGLVIVTLYALMRIKAIGLFNPASNFPIDKLSIVERLIALPSNFQIYLKTFVYPINLSSSYQEVNSKIGIGNFYSPLIIDLLFLFTCFYIGVFLYKRKREFFKTYIFFFSWFLIGIGLHLQVIPLDYSASERWFYFPIVGLLGMIGVILTSFNLKQASKWLTVVIVLLLLFLSVRTINRAKDWKDDFTLASHDIKVSKSSYDLENRIALGLAKKERFDEALSHAQRSVKLFPNVGNYNTLGIVYLNLGDYEHSRKAFVKELNYVDYFVAYENLSLLAVITRQNSEIIQKGLTKFPKDAKLWMFLAMYEYETNSTDSAKVSISRAFSLDKDETIRLVYYKIFNGLPLDLQTQPFKK